MIKPDLRDICLLLDKKINWDEIIGIKRLARLYIHQIQ